MGRQLEGVRLWLKFGQQLAIWETPQLHHLIHVNDKFVRSQERDCVNTIRRCQLKQRFAVSHVIQNDAARVAFQEQAAIGVQRDRPAIIAADQSAAAIDRIPDSGFSPATDEISRISVLPISS